MRRLDHDAERVDALDRLARIIADLDTGALRCLCMLAGELREPNVYSEPGEDAEASRVRRLVGPERAREEGGRC